MTQALKTTFLALLFVAGEVAAQFCPGVSPWVFDDVPSTHPFCTQITWMAQRGVTLGCGVIDANHRLYCPGAGVNRAEMAAFMYRLGSQNSLLQGGNAFGATGVLGTTDNEPLELITGGSRAMRYEPNALSPNVIGGIPENNVTATAHGATIAGGGVLMGSDPNHTNTDSNRVTDNYGTVSGGAGNRAGDDAGTTTDAPFATVGGGANNRAMGHSSVVGGGTGNTAGGDGSFVGSGQINSALGLFSAVAGGRSNRAAGEYSAVGGGWLNEATGDFSFVAGRRARALAAGTFSFADSNDFDFTGTTPNRFRVRATGGVLFVTDINSTGGIAWSCLAVAGAGWSCSSDRNQKQNLRELDGRSVLERVVSLPVYEWNPKGRNAHVNHYGPTAQDFHAAFGLGDDDTRIGTQDADGVALAAIQGLNAKLDAQLRARDELIDEQRVELAAQRAEIAGMRQMMDLLLARQPLDGDVAGIR